MKLYYMPGACSLASHIGLVWAGAPYTLARLDHDEVHATAFLEINPKGAVPALIVMDGSNESTLTESLAVLLYIADMNPAAQLGAQDRDPIARARLNEVLAELVSEVHKAFAPIFAPERFSTDEGAYDGVRAAAHKQIDKAFEQLERRVNGDWMVLGHRTVADAYLHVMCRWKVNTPTGLVGYPNLSRHKAKLEADPGVIRAVLEEESATLASTNHPSQGPSTPGVRRSERKPDVESTNVARRS